MAEGQRMTTARGAVEELMRSEHVDVLPQFNMLVAAARSIVLPSGKVRVPDGGPSMNDDCDVPVRMRFQSGMDSRSCMTRSIPASAAYMASPPSR